MHAPLLVIGSVCPRKCTFRIDLLVYTGVWVVLCLIAPGSAAAQDRLLREHITGRGIEPVESITKQYGNGAAIADYDGDGHLDIYLPTDAGIPDRLYRNDGSGYFTDVAGLVGLRDTVANRTALWFDYDGDHRLDLVVAGEFCVNRICDNPIHLALYRQTATGTFLDVTATAGLLPAAEFTNLPFYAIGGLAAGDVNGDDYLDLLLSVWGGGVQLFLNNTDGTFRDATLDWELTPPADTPWQPLIYDFDGDGRQDIYCNIDFTANNLWINQGSSFVDRAWDYGLDRYFNEMGVTAGDYNNDGAIDLYLTNITRQFNGMDQHNLLLTPARRGGQLFYRETARSQGVSQSGWDWGTSFADLDNDGWQDLVTTNGWWDMYAYYPDSSRAWRNSPAGFVDVSATWGFQDTLPATTLLAFDMDRDGDVDLLQTLKENTVTDAPLILYENQRETLAGPNNYVSLQPRMPGANHFAIGSVVTVVADELTLARLITAGCSFYGQEPAEAHFGLGQRTEITEARVRWPNGEVTVHPELAVNSRHILPYRPLPAPSELIAQVTDGAVGLEWRDNSTDELGFVLHRSPDTLFTSYTKIDLPANTVAFTDSVATGTTYHYRVRAYVDGVQSAESNAATAEIAPAPAAVTDGLTILYANPLADGYLRLSLEGGYTGPVRHRLFDVAGREVWQANDEKTLYRQRFTHLLDLSRGGYVLLSSAGAHEYGTKLLIHTP